MTDEPMIKLFLGLPAPVLRALQDVALLVAGTMPEDLVVRVSLVDDDEDLYETWVAGLRESLAADVSALTRLFKQFDPDNPCIMIPVSGAEKIMRACTAIRLRIRETLLHAMSDAELESGRVSLKRLTLDQQRAYACYAFLGSLQGHLISALEGDGDDDA